MIRPEVLLCEGRLRSPLFAVLLATALTFATAWVQPHHGYAQQPDSLDIARRLARAGAVELAFARVEQDQPKDAKARGWSDWELLRIELLARRGADGEALKRIASLGDQADIARAAPEFWIWSAHSAVRAAQGSAARRLLSRILWVADPPPAAQREARLLVIESLLADAQVDHAYRSMLRFAQDYVPLRPEEAETFVAALIERGRAGDAVVWLPQLDAESALAALLRLQTGLLAPPAAVAQARTLLRRDTSDATWNLLLAAARAQKDLPLEIEAHEGQLGSAPRMSSAQVRERADALWKLYANAAVVFGNRANLLVGDEAAWFDRAASEHALEPRTARALWGHLALTSRDPTIRREATLRLIGSLSEARRPATALRLFADADRFAVAELDPRVRYQLGGIAVEQRIPAEAARFWRDLAPPQGVSARDWHGRYGAALFQAGMMDIGLRELKAMIDEKPPLGPDELRRLSALAEQATDEGHAREAVTLLSLLLPFAAGDGRTGVLLGLAHARELAGAYRDAADAYLQAATANEASKGAADAISAREAAARNLLRAGLRDDARAVYRWLAQHATDPVTRERAARALQRL